jgi:hypothetical protein
MREQVVVNYLMELICEGGEFTHEFSHIFDSELYYADEEGIDVTTIHFKMKELKEKYGDDLFLFSFSVYREKK